MPLRSVLPIVRREAIFGQWGLIFATAGASRRPSPSPASSLNGSPSTVRIRRFVAALTLGLRSSASHKKADVQNTPDSCSVNARRTLDTVQVDRSGTDTGSCTNSRAEGL